MRTGCSRWWLVPALWLALSAAVARAGEGSALRIVTTTTDLKSIAEDIGGDKVSVSSLATGHEDPHFIAAKPSYMMLARKADLWIRVGLEMEIGYEELILDGSRNPRIRIGTSGHLDASVGVLRLEVPTQEVDRSMGDVHPLGNPHYWLDPLNGRVVARNIARRLIKLDPGNADYYRSRHKAFTRRLDEAVFGEGLVGKLGGATLWKLVIKDQFDRELKKEGLTGKLGGWMKTMRPYRGSRIVTYHRSWSYLANRFGLIVLDELEPKPGIPPSPGHVTEVIAKIKAQGTKALLMEPFYSRKAPDLLAKETGIKVVPAANTVGGQPRSKDYLSMLDNVIARLTSALGGAGASTRPAP